jgi:PleD family two-component response regulator
MRLISTCRRPIYVLMMSSQYDQRSLIEALDSGADDFIGKPPLAEELYARFRAAERILAMQRDLIRLATIDPLTGLSNRRGFFERATEPARAWLPRWKPVGDHSRYRQFQTHQRLLRA